MPDMVIDLADSEHVLFVAEFEIEHEDVFHLKNLYKLIYEWFGVNDFKSMENDDKWETLYWQRVLQSGDMEHHMWWRVQKIPYNNKYYKYYVKFDFQTLNMGKAETTVKGQKLSTNKGDLIIRCRSYLVLDYSQEGRKHPIMKYMHKRFIKRIYKKQIDYLKGDLWTLTYKLQDVIKQYMRLKNPYEMPKSFHPELGV